MNKKLVYFGLVILLVAVAFWYGLKMSFSKKYESVKADVIIEQMREVAKMVSVEANVSEMYNHKEYYSWDISPLRKSALVRVNAKVMAGFDLDKMVFTVDSINRTIIISNIPSSEIIAIDHDLDYYDISEGVFNKFSENDYNKINAKVKLLVEKKALESDILSKADLQRDKLLDLYENMIEAMGYRLETKQLVTPSFRG